jgi:hypothetical protein
MSDLPNMRPLYSINPKTNRIGFNNWDYLLATLSIAELADYELLLQQRIAGYKDAALTYARGIQQRAAKANDPETNHINWDYPLSTLSIAELVEYELLLQQRIAGYKDAALTYARGIK